MAEGGCCIIFMLISSRVSLQPRIDCTRRRHPSPKHRVVGGCAPASPAARHQPVRTGGCGTREVLLRSVVQRLTASFFHHPFPPSNFVLSFSLAVLLPHPYVVCQGVFGAQFYRCFGPLLYGLLNGIRLLHSAPLYLAPVSSCLFLSLLFGAQAGSPMLDA